MLDIVFNFLCKIPCIFTVSSSKKNRHYVFTLNNPVVTAVEPQVTSESQLQALPGVTYLCYGREHYAAGSGTAHLQGVISFISPRSNSAVRKLIPRWHVEVQRGNHLQATTYCKKDGDWFERGSRTMDPDEQHTDQAEKWQAAWDSAVAGRLDEIPISLRVPHYRTWNLVQRDYQRKPVALEGTCGHWIYGPSRTGKSHFVNERFPEAYIKDASKWWCGYQGEDTVWLDDVDPSQTSWIARFLKIWGDRYPFQAQSKGGSLLQRPKRIIITSNYSLAAMGFAIEDLVPIRERFVEHFKSTRDTIIEI